MNKLSLFQFKEKSFNVRWRPELKGVLLSGTFGTISGLVAFLFSEILDFTWSIFMEKGAGVMLLPHPLDFQIRFHSSIYFILPVLGALIAGFIIFKFAPEARGHGTDHVISTFHRKQGVIRAAVPIIKALASAITIGTGGSAGKEGPIAQIGGGIASFLSQKLRLTERERRIYLLAGAGAGIGAIFKSPFGGAIFAIEVLYRGSELETDAFTHSIIASISAYMVFGILEGWEPIFTTPQYKFSLLHTPIFILLGFFTLPFAYAYTRFFGKVSLIFTRSMIPKTLQPFTGSLALGAILVFFPYAAGPGYEWIQAILNQEVPVLFLLCFITFKMLATTFTISSGGSGGVFAPSIGIGAGVGALFGILVKKFLPQADISTGAFALTGMAAFFSCAAKVPLASIIMVLEMTGNYHLLVPAVATSFISFFFSGKWSIYSAQVDSRRESPAHAGDFIVDVLDQIRIVDATSIPKEKPALKPAQSTSDALQIMLSSRYHSLPVTDENGNFIGLVFLDDLRSMLNQNNASHLSGLVKVNDMVRDDLPVLKPDDTLRKAMSIFVRTGVEELPVVSENGKFLTTLSHSELISAYEMAIKGRTHTTTTL